MEEFVLLNLHTEFSLLDGACRIDELLDEAVKRRLPALAVTEHGNCFRRSVPRPPRERGLSRSWAARSTWHRAAGSTRAATDRDEPPGLLAETYEATRTSSSWLIRYTEGFYYRPRTTRTCSRSMRRDSSAEQLLKGSGQRAESGAGPTGARAAARCADILGQDKTSPEMQYQGIEEQKVSTAASCAGLATSICRS